MFLVAGDPAVASPAWLVQQQQPDGSLVGSVSLATAVQDTAEALRSLSVLNSPGGAAISAAVDFVLQSPETNAEYLSRKVIVAALYGRDFAGNLNLLLSSQNPDGGFGEYAGHGSTVIDTLYALDALAAAGMRLSPEARAAVGFVMQRQRPTGAWFDGQNEDSVFLTALATSVLQPYRAPYGLTGRLAAATQFLLSRQGPDGSVGTELESAWALAAIAPLSVDAGAHDPLRAFLLSRRAADTSWGADVYLTAVALRALNVAATTDPAAVQRTDLGEIWGRLTDADTGAPLANAAVGVDAGGVRLSAVTGARGEFNVVNVPPGPASLVAAAPGYLDGTYAVQVAAGTVTAAELRLNRDPSPTPLVLSGVVMDDATGQPLGGAAISLEGTALSAVSGQDGRFSFADLAPGVYTVRAALPGYTDSVLVVSAPRGGRLAPAAIRMRAQDPAAPPGQAAVVAGVIRDGLSGMPVPGARISLTGGMRAVVTSDGGGGFQFGAVPAGPVRVGVSASGYLAAGASLQVEPGTRVAVAFHLIRTGNPGTATVTGRVIDAATGNPVSGARVALASGGAATSTLTTGEFLLAGLGAGTVTISIDAPGYATQNFLVTIPSGAQLRLGDIPLYPPAPSAGNQPPVITSQPPASATAGRPYVYQVQATDPDGDSLTFGLRAAPAGMVIDPVSGQVSWVPTASQVGQAPFTVVVSDGRGNLVTQATVVTVQPAGPGVFVVTDVETLSGLIIDDVVPQNYILGSYLQGGTLNFTSVAPACPLTFRFGPGGAAALGQTAVALDRNALQTATAEDAIYDLGQPFETVTIFPQIDHGPFPQEGIEYTVWGSNDPAAPFPDGWSLAGLVAIYARGYETDPTCTGQIETDDYAGLYTFAGNSFRYIRVRANFSISIFDSPARTAWAGQADDDAATPGWQSHDAEVDGVGGMLCGAPPAVDAGNAITGVAGQPVSFSASGPQDIRAWGWDVDGDGVIDASGQTASYTFSVPFDGLVRLIAVDAQGCIGTDTVSVLVREGLSLPDLTVPSVDPAGVTFDIDTLRVEGNVVARIDNGGQADVRQGFAVTAFFDTNGNGTFDSGLDTALGEVAVPVPLPAGGTRQVVIPVAGTASMPDQPIHVMVDSAGTVDETDESNNTGNGNAACPAPLPDLVLSGLRITQGTSGTGSTITVRMSNAGTAPPSAAPLVAFYAGDPAAGGVLLDTVSGSLLGPGRFDEIALPLPGGLAAGTTVYARVDESGVIAECREDNNSMSLAVPARSVDGSVTASLDAARYGPNSDVVIAYSVANNSAYPGQFSLDLLIETAGGGPVATVAGGLPVMVDGLGTMAGQARWNTGLTLAGGYRLRAVLRDAAGRTADEAIVPFAIVHPAGAGPMVSLRVTTDRPAYRTTDTVMMDNLITNASANAALTGTRLSITVSDPAGGEVFAAQVPVGDLLPGAQLNPVVPDGYVDRRPATYRVRARLLDAAGNTLAEGVTAYAVRADPAADLTGQVLAEPREVQAGQTVMCTDSVGNPGSRPYDSVNLARLVVSVDEGKELASVTGTHSLAAGGSLSLSRSIDTSGFAPGNYACVLRVEQDGVVKTMDAAPFVVLPPAVAVDLDLRRAGPAKLLALVHPACSGDPGEDDDGHDAADTGDTEHAAACDDQDEQSRLDRDYLSRLLRERAIAHTIVENEAEFLARLRSGRYGTYALLGSHHRVDGPVEDELAAAVLRGEGLLAADGGDDPEDALGLERDVFVDATQVSVDTFGAYPGAVLALAAGHHVAAAELEGAQTIARVTGPQRDPAPVAGTTNGYGDGRAVWFGFDLLREARLAGTGSEAGTLLVQALRHAGPQAVAALPGRAVPLAVGIVNRGAAAQLVVEIGGPPDVIIEGIEGAGAPGTVHSASVSLEEDGRVEIPVWVRAESAGAREVQVRVFKEAVAPENLVSQSAVTVGFEAAPQVAEFADELAALAAAGADVAEAAGHAARAAQHAEAADFSAAIDDMLETIDDLEEWNAPGAGDLRIRAALVLRGLEREWYAARQPPAGGP